MSHHEIGILVGTRPEIIKMSPLIEALDENDLSYKLIHTGQHYSENMDEVFFDNLEIDAPDTNLDINKMESHERLGNLIINIGDAIEGLSGLVVQGDTDSVLAGSIAAAKMEKPLVHLEAGLRSGNKNMPEEKNRIISDHVSDFLFCPTETSKKNLKGENVNSGIHVCGNTIVEAVERNIDIAHEKNQISDELPDEFVLATIHRKENTEDRRVLKEILCGISEVASRLDVKALIPIHPRTEAKINEFDIDVPEGISIKEPFDYLDFLFALDESKLALTDSGGVQEEACILGTPCVTVREETERPETVKVGANLVSGTEQKQIVEKSMKMVGKEGWKNPLGDGNTSKKVVEVLKNENIV